MSMNAAKFRPRPPMSKGEQSPLKKVHVAAPESSAAAVGRDARRSLHTHGQLWKWTLTSSAVAPCRVQDIFALEECEGTKGGMDPDFFWLGRVPCRSVTICGVVVGVQQYEQRTLYSLDDGTGMVECNLRHNLVQPPASPRKSASHALSKYQPPKESAAGSSKNSAEPPKPVAAVGDIIRVVGRVLNRHWTRIVNAERIAVCRSPTEEPLHWLAVADLHKLWYHPPNPELFFIPKPVAPATQSTQFSKSTRVASQQAPSEPSSPLKASIASSAPSTPSSATTTSVHGPHSPPRLRHPSRLHSRDLTANTFRIYFKHYMDNSPLEKQRRRQSSPTPQTQRTASDNDEEDLEKLRAWLPSEPETPTKQRRKGQESSERLPEPTPRPNRLRLNSDWTPRPNASTVDDDLRGFTLSHLRRVPELALLAKRVVDAEAKRRTREERKKVKEQTQPSLRGKHASPTKSYRTSATSVKASVASAKPGEPKAAKMKRLFRYTIRQLYDEGSIVLWDGPVRAMPLAPIPAPAFSAAASTYDSQKENKLWRAKDSQASSASQEARDPLDGDGELSDPPEDEDAYVPLTSAYLCKIVEGAIGDIITKPRHKKAGPPPGPTPEEITSHLRRRDERWARVGDWAIKDALEWGKEQGRVWCIGDNRWEVCG
ncbi:uncharacterized protein PHACADRAFT_171327 [Phanerochaete carnosa HHB-10118-sp]|uniref:CST complex subunit STN1 n=1 Tax=Phanerochaete carnosa (strain HHB-10118-sp) TaxID=650164 RepID=K5X5F5_PHACS|nr:uncharacterized protein PHACADRAFT_171327 [Phanerochaete carnosa HHB-10118-sp]EKM58092.1 hypothetical protein PHACADRAFT_171327 [Phanerochaete carnosa HHB-10118-sp]